MNNYTNPVTVTGNPASFESSGNGKLLSLSVPFSPIQDLHGYDNPWPAGGGKNLLDDSIKSSSAGGYVFFNTAGDRYHKTTTLQAGTYTFSVTYSQAFETTKAHLRIYDVGTDTMLAGAYNATKISFTLTEITDIAIYVQNSGLTVSDILTAQLERGSTVTSWEPYENICPIIGRTGLSLYVGPTTAQADATTYAVYWTTEAGTVYGGTDEVVGGSLESTYGMVDLGTLTWYKVSTTGTHWRFWSYLNDMANNGEMLSSQYKHITASQQYMGEIGIASQPSGSNHLVMVSDERFSDAATFKTAMSGVQLCYELTTPLTYQLTPTQVELLIGQNNVWSDSNEAVTLTYVIELFTRYTFIVNGNDYTGLVERDSYRTAVTPVYGETIQTLDGVGHTALLRVKGSLTVKLNPQTAAQTAAICADLLNAPCEVQYKCLQRNVNVTALMVLDVVSAMFLSRCLYLGQKWNDVDEIVLKEL